LKGGGDSRIDGATHLYDGFCGFGRSITQSPSALKVTRRCKQEWGELEASKVISCIPGHNTLQQTTIILLPTAANCGFIIKVIAKCWKRKHSTSPCSVDHLDIVKGKRTTART